MSTVPPTRHPTAAPSSSKRCSPKHKRPKRSSTRRPRAPSIVRSLSGGAGYLTGSPFARAYRDIKAGTFVHPLGANRAYDYLAHIALGERASLH